MRVHCFGVVAVLLFASAALGDGCYIPERAIRKIPEIPAQRAILLWKDGIETLIISSALDSEAQKLGWIIPIPAVPQTIEKESSGGLKTLDFCIQPEITHDLYPGIKAAVLTMLVANLLMGTFLFKRQWFVKMTILVFVVVVLLPALMLPAGAGISAAMKAANVRVEKSATVGSYDINILRSTKPDELNAWLVESGLSPLPAAADKTIADYIAKGWVFAAIKLTRVESGTNVPHPIKMVFAARDAVYPMRLTAIAGGSPQFEIYVIGNSSASCSLLKKEFCDRFSKIEHDEQDTYETKVSFTGITTHQEICHPAICSLLWDHCILTKFAGTINSNDMTSDIQFDWKPFEACQQHFYTASGARYSALILFVLLTGGWGFVSMIVFNKRILQPRGVRWYFGKALIPAIALFAVGAGILFTGVPKLNASDVHISSGLHRLNHAWIELAEIDTILEDHPEILQGTNQEIADYLLKLLDERALNNPTGSKTIIEDSPGNFTVEKCRDKVVIRVYDHNGMVLRTEHPTAAQAGMSTKP